jgi:hypothetical protein
MPAMKGIASSLTVLVIFMNACSSYKGKSFVPAVTGYDDRKREVFVLKKDLLEISGLVNIGGTTFASINDEQGELFFVNIANDSIVKYRFKGKGDYEDLARVDSTYYILESSGDIVEVNPPYTSHTTYKFEGKNMEFESLVYYPDKRKLVMIVKDQKKRTTGIHAFSFDLATRQYDTDPFFTISLKQIFSLTTNYDTDCKPSAAAINPINNRLYVVASVGKVMLECDRNGKLYKIYKLNPVYFPQPEGISFATNGDMYISNEGANGKATILKFPYSGRK